MIITGFTNKDTKILSFILIIEQCYFLFEEEPISLLFNCEKGLVAQRFLCGKRNLWKFYFTVKLA